MSIREQLDTDIKEAMKAKNTERLATIRLIKTEVMKKEVEKGRSTKDLSEQEFIELLSRMVKQRKESIDQYKNAGRDDLAQAEETELAIINEYLPKPLSEEELVALIQEAIKTSGATGPKDMGAVMKELKEKVAGKVDGKVLADSVRAALQ